MKGRTSPRAWALYSDSEMMRPARKAPRARERPAREVSQAAAKPIPTVAKRNTSRLRVRATRKRSQGTAQRAATITSPTMRIVLKRRFRRGPAMSPPPRARRGVKSIMGTMAMSWKMRIPRAVLP